MHKTSLYLSPADVARLNRLARREKRPKAQIIRDALAAYDQAAVPDRRFAVAASWQGDGTSVADVPESELLKDFGR